MSGSNARREQETASALTRLVIVRERDEGMYRALQARFALDPGTLVMFDRRRPGASARARDERRHADMHEVLRRRGYYVVRFLPGRCCMIRACSSSASTSAARSPISRPSTRPPDAS